MEGVCVCMYAQCQGLCVCVRVWVCVSLHVMSVRFVKCVCVCVYVRGERGSAGQGERGRGVLTIQLALEAHYPHLQYFHIANPRFITVNSKTKLAWPLGCKPKCFFIYIFLISSTIPLRVFFFAIFKMLSISVIHASPVWKQGNNRKNSTYLKSVWTYIVSDMVKFSSLSLKGSPDPMYISKVEEFPEMGA